MSALDSTLVYFLLLTGLNYWAHRSVLYPPFIFSAMFLLDLAVFRTGWIEVYPLHGNTLAIVAGGATLFSVGGALAGLTPAMFLRIHLFPRMPKQTPELLRRILMLIVVACLPILFYEVFQISRGQPGTGGMLMAARLAEIEAAENGEPIHGILLDYFVLFASFSSLLLATEKKDRQFWIVTTAAFFGCILSTGRTNLLLLISGLSAIRLLQSKRENLWAALRMLRWPILMFVVLYIGLVFTNKDVSKMAGGAVGIAEYFVLSYIVGPLAAFDSVVQHPLDFVTGTNHTFEFPLKVASALHLTSYAPPPKLDSYVLVPFPTNVYTAFKFYFLDVGISGMLFIMLVVGLIHSLLYLKARQGGRLSLALFGYSFYAVLMVIFDDAYYTVGSYLRVFVFGFLYLMLSSLPLRVFPSVSQNPEKDRLFSS